MARVVRQIPYRLEVAKQLAVRMCADSNIGRVLKQYWHLVPCPNCGHYDDCGCRNRKADVASIMSFYKETEDIECNEIPIEFLL